MAYHDHAAQGFAIYLLELTLNKIKVNLTPGNDISYQGPIMCPCFLNKTH